MTAEHILGIYVVIDDTMRGYYGLIARAESQSLPGLTRCG